MRRIIRLCQSTIGLKAIVAVTGIILFGFVFLHMIGNLKSFLPQNADGVPDIDVYAKFLRTMGEPLLPYTFALWVVRVTIIVAVVLHVVMVTRLAARNRAARPIRYHHKQVHEESTFAARMMLVSGGLLLVFVTIHLFQFTWGVIDYTPIVPGKVYGNLYDAFHKWGFVLFYVLSMAVLGFHLYHGAWSLFQTLGYDNADRNRGLRLFAAIAASVIFLGFIVVPVMFYIGVMPTPPTVGGQ
jgi:succinate dehydrogenase / fumarate reductase cytochrome b subunit